MSASELRPFSPRALFLLIGVGALAFAAMAHLMISADDRAARGGEVAPSADSRSAIGYRAFVKLMERLDVPVGYTSLTQAQSPSLVITLEPRGAVMADVRLNGEMLRVVGMHLDLSGLWRRRQAHAIMAHAAVSTERHATVMMGDLNEWSATTGAMRDFAHGYRAADTGPSFHARRPVARLDRIMVSPDLRIVSCGA